MAFWNNVSRIAGNLTRGFIGESDEERRRKQQQTQNAPPKPPTAPTPRPPQQVVQTPQRPQQVQLPSILQPKTDPFGIHKPATAPRTTPVQAPRVEAPKVNLSDMVARANKAKILKTKDVNGYFKEDADKLEAELRKGDKANPEYVRGLAQSLENRQKELNTFHTERGNTKEFQRAKELEVLVKDTRGNHKEATDELGKYYRSLNADEKDAFNDFRNPNKNKEGKWKTSMQDRVDLDDDVDRLGNQQAQQKIADAMLNDPEYDAPIPGIGKTGKELLYEYNEKMTPGEQLETKRKFQDTLERYGSNPRSDPEVQRIINENYVALAVLDAYGKDKSDAGTKWSNFARGAERFGKSMVVDPLAKVYQSGEAIVGYDPYSAVDKDFADGKIDNLERAERLERLNREHAWHGDGRKEDGTIDRGFSKDRLFKAAGAGADATATIVPFLSMFRGAKAGSAARAAMTAKAGTAGAQTAAKNVLGRTLAREGLENAAYSGVGALREGEDVTGGDIVNETLLGGTTGVAFGGAGYAGGNAWRRLFPNGMLGRKTNLDDVLEANAGQTANLENVYRGDDALRDALARGTEEQVVSHITKADNLDAILENGGLKPNQVLDDNGNPLPNGEGENAVYTQEGTNNQFGFPDESNINIVYNKDRLPNSETVQGNEVIVRGGLPNTSINRIQVPDEATAERVRAAGFAAEVVPSLAQGRATPAAELAAANATNNQQLDMGLEGAQQRIDNAAVDADAPTPVDTPPVTAPGNTGDVSAANAVNDQADQITGTDYVTAQQDLEGMAGNKTMGDLAGQNRLVPRIPSSWNKPLDVASDATTSTLGSLVGTALRSQNPVINKIGQLFYGLNQKSTLSTSEKTLTEQLIGRRGGQGKLIDDLREVANAPLAQLDEATQIATREKIFDAMSAITDGRKFDKPELVEQGTAILNSLNPVEAQYLRNITEMGQLRNRLQVGMLSDEVLQQGVDGMHMPRIYNMDEFATDMGVTRDEMVEIFANSRNKTLDLNPTKRRKQIDQISEELQKHLLRDPVEANLIRTDIAMHNRAIFEFATQAAKAKDAIGTGGAKGYLPIPDSPKYGDLAGEWVRKDLADKMLSGSDRFESEMYQKVSDFLDVYQSSALGKLEGYLRQGLTVFNPATRLGNRGANITMSQLAGFNVPEMALKQQKYVRILGQGGNEMTRLAQTFGAIDKGDALSRFSGVTQQSDQTIVGKLQASYQHVDDAAKVAMFEWQMKKNGGDPQEAARFVNRALPNIGNSGEIYRFFSRLPVLGVPFRAIQPEVMRALASNGTRHAVPFLTAMAAYTTFQNWTWDEIPEEDRRQVEERFGAGRTPFAKLNEFAEEKTGIQTSKVLPSTWSFNAGRMTKALGLNDDNNIQEVDPRRLMGMYSINTNADTGGGALDELKKISPVQIPIKYEDGQVSFQPQEVVGSRTFQPIAQVLMDRDFRGKSIQDPEGKIYNPDGTISRPFVNPDTLQPESISNWGRAGQSLLRSWLPQVNDLANVKDAHDGKETFYGQEMTVPQAIGRLFGLKGEQFSDERLTDMKQTQEYFVDREAIDADAAKMPPSEAEAYRRASGYYNLREKVPNEFKPGEERYKNAPVYNFPEDKYKDLSANPGMYDLVKLRKEKDAARTGAPIQPIYDDRLSEGFRKQLIQNRSAAPGDNAELDQRMYSNPEWDTYQAINEEYKAKAAQYYPQSGDDEFTDELVKNNNAKFPEKPAAKKAYDDAYKLYNEGKGAKPVFNDAVEAAKAEHETAKWNWTNNERLKRGLAPIPKEMWDNVTFGYESDEEKVFKELKYGKGFGGGGGGGGSYNNDFGKLHYISNLAGSGENVDNAPRHKTKFTLTGANTIAAAQKVSRGSGRRVTLKT